MCWAKNKILRSIIKFSTATFLDFPPRVGENLGLGVRPPTQHWDQSPVISVVWEAQTEIFANPGWKIEKSSNRKHNNTAQKVVLSSANTLIRRINRGRTQIIKPYWHHTDLDRSNFQNVTLTLTSHHWLHWDDWRLGRRPRWYFENLADPNPCGANTG